MNCQTETRRDLVRAHRSAQGHPDLNGLDYVEVANDQTTLVAYFLGKLPRAWHADARALLSHLRIEGGRRIRAIHITGVKVHLAPEADQDDYLILSVDQPGDFSTYTLCLVGLPDIDPRYDRADFSFKVNCPSDLDCAAPPACPPPAFDEPDLNYLAKDYASFRQLILDRLAVIMPGWQERHAPDLEVALVEVLAYVGDHLSYYQDAVATEAYLDTARQRISVRRHARLVDYRLHEGNNARAWVCVTTDQKLDLSPDSFYFVTDLPGLAKITGRAATDVDLRPMPEATYEVFEPLPRHAQATLPLRVAHNEIAFYTWGDRECCLPRGATSATLLDCWVPVGGASAKGATPASGRTAAKADSAKPEAAQPNPPRLDPAQLKRTLELHVGDVLILEEVLGPKTGNTADADPRRRCAVRLTKVTPTEDPAVPAEVTLNEQSYWQPTTPVVEVEWAAADALPFALCLSAIIPAKACQYVDGISVARGNVALVDHGRTLLPDPEYLGQVPLQTTPASCDCEGEPGDIQLVAGRFEWHLSKARLTYSQPVTWTALSAGLQLQQDPRAAGPNLCLISIPGTPDGRQPLFTWADLKDPTSLAQSLLRLGWSNSQNKWTPEQFARACEEAPAAAAHCSLHLATGTRHLLSKAQNPKDVADPLRQALAADLRAMLETWTPRFDLLNDTAPEQMSAKPSADGLFRLQFEPVGVGPDDHHFVVETDNDGVAHLRFGDGGLGRRPTPGSAFYALYRVGNGLRGNVGADAITQFVSRSLLDGVTLTARNPLPAAGGMNPEPIAEAKLFAPSTFRQQLERAITADDYARITQREFAPALQQAAARLTWTGSWYEAEVALDPLDAERAGGNLKQDVRDKLRYYRRLGHDLRVEAAHYVPLEIELKVCVQPDYLRGHVKAALLEVFSNRRLADGRLGFFHPNRLTFGAGVYLSQMVAAAQAVEGVARVSVTKLQRLFEAPNGELASGVLPLGVWEIAQVDNDPSYPEHGRFTLVMGGGR